MLDLKFSQRWLLIILYPGYNAVQVLESQPTFRRNIPPKFRFTFIRLHGVTYHKAELKTYNTLRNCVPCALVKPNDHRMETGPPEQSINS
jgi:hypothetical protein